MSKTIRKEHQMAGQGAVFLTAILWSSTGLFVKLLVWHPLVIFGIRSLIAAIFLIIVRHFSSPSKQATNKSAPLWIGAFAFSLAMLNLIFANRLTTAANAILLHYCAPIWAAFLAWWLIKEKPRREHLIALVLISGGLVLFSMDALGSGAILGDILGFSSGIFFALYSVLLRKMKDGNPLDIMLLGHIISAVIGLPFVFIYPPLLNFSSIMIILYMGIFQIGLSSVLFVYGIKRVRAIQAMLIATIEPILSPVWVLLIIGEVPSFTALAGGAIILTAVTLSSILGRGKHA
jgi:drug/metabolite transporter (DMT)-like permease